MFHLRPNSRLNPGAKFPPPRSVATRHLNTSRHVTLPCILTLSWTTFILAVIYAACVGQSNHQRQAILHHPINGSSTTSTASVWDRRDSGMRIPGTYRTNPISSPSNTTVSSHQNSTEATPALAPLIFYSATLPLCSLTHATIESIFLKLRPQALSQSHISHLLLTTSILLASGWIITSAFWTHCELSLTNASVCPAQIRNHLMYGILELSVAKSVLGWCVVAAYIVHAVFLLRWLQIIRQWNELKEKLGNWADEEDREDDRLAGRGRAVVVHVESGSVGAGATAAAALAKEVKTAKGVRVQTAEMEPVELHTQPQRMGPPTVAPTFPPPPTRPMR